MGNWSYYEPTGTTNYILDPVCGLGTFGNGYWDLWDGAAWQAGWLSQVVEDKLHFNVVMKTNDLFNAWPGNAYAFSELQKHMAEQIGVGVGHYTHFSVSMQVYQEVFEAAKEI